MMFLWLLSAVSWADCEINQDEIPKLVLGDGVELVADGNDCSSCVWEITSPDRNGGVLQDDSGESAAYFAPETIDECEAFVATVTLTECGDDSIDIVLDCAAVNMQGWKSTGGGCNSPQYAYLLLLPLFFRRSKSGKKQAGLDMGC